jgi:hypothetical protein
MLLNADYIDPASLTGYARSAMADLQVNRFTLSRWLPNNVIDDLMYRFTRGGEGLVEAATFRSYDTESPVASRPGVTRVTGELPPISRKIRLGEYDRLRQRRDPGFAVRNGIMTDAERMTRAVAARMELARGDALVNGTVTLNENGVIGTVDFGRTAGHTVTAGTVWTNAAATPVTDLLTWRDTYVDTNGEEPGAILTSRRVVSLLMRNEEVRNVAFPSTSTQPAVISDEVVNRALAAFGLPPIYQNDAKVRVGNTATRIIPDDRLLFLPAPGDGMDPESTDLGATLWGTTAESLEPDFGIEEGEEPGIVAGAYSTKDPVAVWTKAAGIGLPVLANPDLSFCADVA